MHFFLESQERTKGMIRQGESLLNSCRMKRVYEVFRFLFRPFFSLDGVDLFRPGGAKCRMSVGCFWFDALLLFLSVRLFICECGWAFCVSEGVEKKNKGQTSGKNEQQRERQRKRENEREEKRLLKK
mmetsp:Transcript_16733/g.33977  ORF Transcript_16733/g.33977 Transcript_16733/m.33977 type:complete len:127 (+) Transcript_16733:2516-2896(+)